MSRLIDADALLNEVFERHCKNCNKRKGMKNGRYKVIYEIGEAPCRACEIDDTIDYLEEAPTVDAVEVVRCKDCRHYGWTENRIPSEREWWCYEWNDAREETDFCSHAERWQDEVD